MKPYETPTVSAIGTIAGNTLVCVNKESGVGDLFTFNNEPTEVICEDTSA